MIISFILVFNGEVEMNEVEFKKLSELRDLKRLKQEQSSQLLHDIYLLECEIYSMERKKFSDMLVGKFFKAKDNGYTTSEEERFYFVESVVSSTLFFGTEFDCTCGDLMISKGEFKISLLENEIDGIKIREVVQDRLHELMSGVGLSIM